MKKSNSSQKECKALFIISAALLLVYTFFINHVDCNTIVTWGYDLLESVRYGSLEEFPVYTYKNHFMATNYTLISNIVNAVWLIPVYLMDKLFSIGFSIIVYDIWYKILILLTAIGSLLFFSKILIKLKTPVDKKVIALYTMSTSSIVLIAVLGKGQIDMFDLFLVLLSMYAYLNNRVQLSFLFIGLGCLFKPFIILLGIPYLCLMIGRSGIRTLFNGLLLVLPYILDVTVTRVLMPRYGKMADITSEAFADIFGKTRIEQLFATKVNNVYIFFLLAIIVCGICIYIGIENRTKEWHLIIFPTIMYSVFAFIVDATVLYWYVVIVPLLVLMGCSLRRPQDFLIINFVMNVLVPFLYVYMEEELIPGRNYSVLDSISKTDDLYPFMENLSYFRYHIGVGTTVFLGCVLLLCIEYIYEKKTKSIQIGDNLAAGSGGEGNFIKGLLFIQALPALLYAILVYVMY